MLPCLSENMHDCILGTIFDMNQSGHVEVISIADPLFEKKYQETGEVVTWGKASFGGNCESIMDANLRKLLR